MANGNQQGLLQQVEDLTQQMYDVQQGGLRQGGLLGGGGGGLYSKSALPPDQIQQVYGLLAAYSDDPTKVGMDYVRAMQTQAQLKGAYGSSPSNVREWEYYQQLSPEDQKRYLEMKRGIDLQTIAGNRVAMFGGEGTNMPGVGDVLSPAAAEAAAAARLRAAEAGGANIAARYNVLQTGQRNRIENYSTARRLRQKVAENDLPTGLYTGLVYKVLPSADQEALDALSERVARAELKANGEVRPTDADVEGMKRALFGSSNTEEFNVDNLERLIRTLEGQEQEMQELSQYMAPAIPGQQYYGPPAQGGGFQMPTPQNVGTPSYGQPQAQPQIDYSQLTTDQLLELTRARSQQRQ